ncbi:MAG TPA: alpha/beta hydrolase, partial [Blastocatellia bacterium]|nr:alpha/beta hydrolase [Blastocatellia bacterium]
MIGSFEQLPSEVQAPGQTELHIGQVRKAKTGYEQLPAKNPAPSYSTTGQGPLLIYIPGLDGTGELSFRHLPNLSRDYQVITYQLRDTGRFTYEDLAADIAHIVQDRNETRAMILGESFGGTIAIEFALRYPEMAERLVLVNSFPWFRKRRLIRYGLFIASRMPFDATWLIRRAAATLGLIVDGIARADRRTFIAAIRNVKKPAYVRRLELISELDLRDRLGEIKAPTLLLAGEKDLL